jgi:hypothetical protein
MKSRGLLIGLLAGLAITGSAQATIIDHGTYLTDTVSGLDWLDVTATIGKSYAQVSANFSNATSAEFGWHYATTTQLEKLVSDATAINIQSYGYTYFLNSDLKPLSTYLGFTESSSNYTVTIGLLNETVLTGSLGSAFLYNGCSRVSCDGYYAIQLAFLDEGYRDTVVGSYLVRETFIPPLPSPNPHLSHYWA